jgi:threonine dehydrogenase-like Zn-dependent dehydrogenase
MKAVLFDGELRFVEDHPVPEPAGDEALLRVLMAGVCRTDLEIIKGYMGFRGVLGHEFVAVVEKAGGKAGGLVGRRVVGEINCGCGTCEVCLGGGFSKTHCPDRTVLGISGRDGALAEYLTLPVKNLLQVPRDVTDEEAVFTEPLAAAFQILNQVHIRPTDRVLVMGDGKLGLLIALALTGASPTLLGKHADNLKIAGERGIETVLLKDMQKKREYDVVVEATGSAEGFPTALGLVRPTGTVVLKSTAEAGGNINLAPLVIDEVTVVGSRCGPFGPALRALSSGRVDVRPLITGIYGFGEARLAFDYAMKRGALKTIVDFR